MSFQDVSNGQEEDTDEEEDDEGESEDDDKMDIFSEPSPLDVVRRTTFDSNRSRPR
jgi:Ran GTPase-activating protein (RanGAP) involved in mRNA processing and transport